MAWVKAAVLSELREKPVVSKHPPLQIAVFHAKGHVYAIDNRCPHEGYPLALGSVNDECVLTCNWHNWKFRLEDGQCLLGGDNVRSYPTRLEGNDVWVDLTPPSREEARISIMRGLKKAFDDRDYERICREIARLHFHGIDPKDSIRAALSWSCSRLEFGVTHAHAGAVDWLALAERFSPDFERQLICIAETFDNMAFDSLHQPEYPYAHPDKPFERSRFLAAVEGERLSEVEGMVARALVDGVHWPDFEEAFAAAAFAHYQAFGHAVIYVSKVPDLISSFDESIEYDVLLPLARRLCYGTREDLIPDFKDYAATLKELAEPRLASSTPKDLEVPFPCNVAKAFGWLAAALTTHDVSSVYNALLKALARNMLHYDASYGASYDRPVNDNMSWLDFTHGLTFANAARRICSRYPQFWRPALLQMACFLGRNADYVDLKLDSAAWIVHNEEAFFADAYERMLDHGIDDPVFPVHLLKTASAVEVELRYATPTCREVLLASLNRYLHSPVKMKHVRRLARQAITLVSRDFEGQ